MCLELGRGRRGLIGHTQPRRLAARSVASRLAEELTVPLGEQVGYQVRFADQSNENTLVKLMTDGILLAETQHDPLLLRYDTLIIDEAHERSLNIDFLLGYLKRLLPKRPDLSIIITSATIDVARFAAHFGSAQRPAPTVEVSGRAYPVEVHYRPLVRDGEDEEDRTLQEGILHAVEEIEGLEREKGWQHGPVMCWYSYPASGKSAKRRTRCAVLICATAKYCRCTRGFPMPNKTGCSRRTVGGVSCWQPTSPKRR